MDLAATVGSFTMFQSAPPAEARGDFGVTGGHRLAHLVSIRSPRRSEGRCLTVRRRERDIMVSIRSPRRSEGRYPSRPQIHILPAAVSIRSPRRSEGRYGPVGDSGDSGKFQSAPPAEARGDRARRKGPRPALCFNPLPPPKRGEIFDCPERCSPYHHVSIRSPRRSEGRFQERP